MGRLIAFLFLSVFTSQIWAQGSFSKYEQYLDELRSAEHSEKWMQRWIDHQSSRLNGKGNLPSVPTVLKAYESARKASTAARGSSWTPVGPDERPPGVSVFASHNLGRINCVAFHPTDTNIIYAGTSQGGVWKTSDHGDTWNPISDDLPVLRISDIHVNAKNPDELLICVGDYAYAGVALNTDDRKRNTHYGVGLYRSTDAGSTWSQTGLNYTLDELDYSLLRRAYIDTGNGDMLAAGLDGIWRSTNGGSSWNQTLDSLIWDIEQDPNDPKVMYASSGYMYNLDEGYAAIHKSSDFGKTWTTLNTGIPAREVQRVEIGIAPGNTDYVYAVTCGIDRGFHSFYRTTDGGANWTQRAHRDSALNILAWSDGDGEFGGQGTYDLAIQVSPDDENLVFTGGINVWGSEDGGANWKGASYWYHRDGYSTHADQHQFKYRALDKKYYVCNDGGLYRTDSIGLIHWDSIPVWPGNYQWPTDWENLTNGMQITAFYRLSISEDNPGNILAGAQDNGTYYKESGSWSNVYGGDGMDNILHPTDPDILYVSSQYGNLRRINSNGQGQGIADQMNNVEEGEWTTPMALSPQDPDVVYAGFGNMWKSDYQGNFWNRISNFPDMGSTGYPNLISCFALNYQDPEDMYVGKRVYFSYGEPSAIWKRDGGTWTNVSTGLPDSLYPTSLEIKAGSIDTAWVTYGGFADSAKVFMTTDGGTNWTNYSQGLPNIPVNVIKRQYYSGHGTMYLGTDVGIYLRTDTSSQWEPVNQDLPNVIVSDLEVHYNEEKLYASTFGRGVWTTDLRDTSAFPPPDTSQPTHSSIHLLNEVTLSAHPNPSAGISVISWTGELPIGSTWILIDALGRIEESGTLEDYQQQIGLVLKPGLHYFQVKAQNATRSIKLISH